MARKKATDTAAKAEQIRRDPYMRMEYELPVPRCEVIDANGFEPRRVVVDNAEERRKRGER